MACLVLLETGYAVLLETGDFLLLEDALCPPPTAEFPTYVVVVSAPKTEWMISVPSIDFILSAPKVEGEIA